VPCPNCQTPIVGWPRKTEPNDHLPQHMRKGKTAAGFESILAIGLIVAGIVCCILSIFFIGLIFIGLILVGLGAILAAVTKNA
jgi:hypothetical protein